MTDLEDRKPDAEAPVPDDIKACVGATAGGDGAALGSALPPEEVGKQFDTVGFDIDGDRNVDLDMTLTAPGCPVAGDMPRWVENAVSAVPGVGQVKVNLVFDPPWEMSRMSDEAKLALNMF